MTLPLNTWTPLRMVLTVCPHCSDDDPGRLLDYEMDILQGNLVAMDGRVYLRRVCRRGHGEVIGLYEEDGALWEDLQQWRDPHPPGRAGRVRRDTRPIPMGYLDGLGESADAAQLHRHDRRHRDLQPRVPDVLRGERPGNLVGPRPGARGEGADARRRHRPRGWQGRCADAWSGGEPTVHPQIADILAETAKRNVTRVILNTNGLRIARDDRFVDALTKLRGRLEVYLQFDGFELPATAFTGARICARSRRRRSGG